MHYSKCGLTSVVQSSTTTSRDLDAILLLIQSRTMLASWAAVAHCWLTLQQGSIRTPQSLSQVLLLSQAHFWMVFLCEQLPVWKAQMLSRPCKPPFLEVKRGVGVKAQDPESLPCFPWRSWKLIQPCFRRGYTATCKSKGHRWGSWSIAWWIDPQKPPCLLQEFRRDFPVSLPHPWLFFLNTWRGFVDIEGPMELRGTWYF